MRKVFSIFVVAALLLCWQAAALAKDRVPVRVAMLPLAAERTSQMPALQTVRAIESRVRDALHIPLNGVLGSVEYVPSGETRQTEERLQAENPFYVTASCEQQLTGLAQSLNADIAVMPHLAAYEQHTYMNWNWDRGMMLRSYVAMELYVYERTTGKVMKKGTSRVYHDEYSASGTADVLARECIDSLLESTRLHESLWEQVKKREQQKPENFTKEVDS